MDSYQEGRWTEALDNGNGIDCIYTDSMKAFDMVPRGRLVEKIRQCGIVQQDGQKHF